ncbi:hypothetical protein D915_007417 [Fasciola hepatica]|uniref:Uncharacterized protein n=1 Tax=Fasciola hepatica TaxID=6192 RepID=A0A2H1C3I2_FASHE|nr:hypothetical protein D915_007417 [Fasciola hepatica]
MVIRYLRQSRAEVASETDASNVAKSVHRIVTVTTGIASNLLLFHAGECIRYSLAAMNVIRYEAGSPTQQAGVLLIIFSFCLNPCLLLYTKVSMFTSLRKCICTGPLPCNWLTQPDPVTINEQACGSGG